MFRLRLFRSHDNNHCDSKNSALDENLTGLAPVGVYVSFQSTGTSFTDGVDFGGQTWLCVNKPQWIPSDTDRTSCDARSALYPCVESQVRSSLEAF